jgi:pSer/pThr/pTyr-binding forkhead associated (FHA) protein
MLLVACLFNGQLVSQHAFTKERVFIGRDDACDIVLDNPGISRRHIEIFRRGEHAFMIRDLASVNGMYINNKLIAEAELVSGDVIQVGKFLLHTRICKDWFSTKRKLRKPWQRDKTLRKD